MTIEEKIQKRINNIVQLSGRYPEYIELTKEEFKQLGTDTFRGVKIKVKRRH